MPASGETILSAPAKVNLFLDVGRLREDGYHEVVSILQTVDLRDRLTVRPSTRSGLALSISDAAVPSGAENTLSRAYRAFQARCPEVPGLQVALDKRIPTQAGLGGGSADAGIFLEYLWKTFAPGVGKEAVARMAAEVGSDVPFFLYRGTCLAEGRGEQVTPLPPLPPCPVLLFHPEVSVSTGAAYRALGALERRRHPSVEPMKEAIAKGDWDGVFRCLHNSFEASVLVQHEPLAGIKAFCEELGFPHTLLAGSGSNLFVLDRNAERLERLAGEAAGRFPALKTTLTSTTSGASC